MAERTTIFRVIDRNTAQMLAKVLMGCYRRGVLDGRGHRDDEGMLREHIAEVRSGDKYGFLGKTAANPTLWRNRVAEVAEECSYISTWNRFQERMGRCWGNYLSAALAVAQEMYCKGIEDYLDNPADDMAEFATGSVKTLWTVKGVRKMDNYRLRSMVQDYCLTRAEEMGDEIPRNAPKRSHYEIFANAFAFAVVAK